jgi:hypothetical protein
VEVGKKEKSTNEKMNAKSNGRKKRIKMDELRRRET